MAEGGGSIVVWVAALRCGCLLLHGRVVPLNKRQVVLVRSCRWKVRGEGEENRKYDFIILYFFKKIKEIIILIQISVLCTLNFNNNPHG
jgi:hypothetical protein